MQRLHELTRGARKWLLLACLALTSLACGGVLLSGANLATRTSSSAIFASGILRMTNPNAGSAILSASGMGPGDTRTGTLTLTNSGSVAGSYRLTASGAVDMPTSPGLSQTLNLTIEDTTSGPAINLYTGTLGSFTQASLGTFTPGQARSYRFEIAWPANSANGQLQGAQTSMTFDWAGTT
jgi:spore coat-associated protein N